MKTNLMVISTNRSDFSHLKLIVEKLRTCESMNVFFVAAGTHFDKKRGYSYDEIVEENLRVDFKIKTEINWKSDSKLFNSLISLQKKLRTLIRMAKIDYIMVLGDRIELLPVINLSLIMGKKLIHISGGERTKGAIDDNIRMMLSLNSYIHFVSGEIFRRNLIEFLKTEDRIFNVGDPILEYIDKIDIEPLQNIANELKIDLKENGFILFTFHPETKSKYLVKDQFKGVEKFLTIVDLPVVATAPNPDKGEEYIFKKLKHLASMKKNFILIPHLGFRKYVSLMKNSLMVMGNSSSLLIEAPYLKVPSLLIGERQEGRPLADSVFKSGYSFEEIQSIYGKIRDIKSTDEKFFKEIKNIFYERKETSLLILEHLKDLICI